jgi:gamma-glutamyltranspeptidase/glutathione hydrolase
MGGFMQPQGHFQVLGNLLDLGMAPQQALDLPRWRVVVHEDGLRVSEPNSLVLLEDGWTFATLAALARRGHHLVPVDGFDRGVFGGGQIILRDPDTGILVAGSDPRKDGCAVGW